MSLRPRQQAPEVTERPAKRSCYKHRMRDPPTSVTQAGMDVLQFQIRQFFHDLFGGKPVGKQLKNIADSNSHSAHTRSSATLFGINCDTFRKDCHVPNSFTEPRLTDSPQTDC